MFLLWLLLAGLTLYLVVFLYYNGFPHRKDEPVYIRGFIPYVGAASYIVGKGVYPYIKETSEKYGGIFTLMLMGKRTHIITDSSAFAAIQKKPKIFSFNPIIYEMGRRLKNLEITEEGFDKQKIRTASMDVNKYLTGDHLENLTKVFGKLTEKKLDEFFDKNQKNGELYVNLHSFVRSVLYYSSSKSILGEDFDSDKTEADFFLFDDKLKLISLGLPRFLIQHVFDARIRVLDQVSKLDFSKSCEYIVAQIGEKRKEEMVQSGFGMLQASQTNTIHASFWTFYHILKDEKLASKIRQEITDKFTIDNYEDSIDSMVHLQGAYLEANRFHNVGISLRAALEDTKIEVGSKSYKIRKGDRIFMIPSSYHDPKLFENPTVFDAERYQGTISEQVRNSQIPYGGGIHLCPGRHFAINEIKLFVILMLKKFNCEFIDKTPLENDYSSLSYLAPRGDVTVKITSNHTLQEK